jgi:predicted nucleotidyltransferase
MVNKKELLSRIKKSVKDCVPDATIILYGSYARGEEKTGSDIDLLILLDKEKITWKDEKEIKYPLYEIEFNTGKIISPLVLAKKDWEMRHHITPFYENIKNDGIIL